MERTDKINFLKAIQEGRLNPNAYSDLPAREFVATNKEQGIQIDEKEKGFFMCRQYKEPATGKIYSDVEVRAIARPYADCMALNALYLAEAATFGIGFPKVSLTALTRAQQLENAFLKLTNQ